VYNFIGRAVDRLEGRLAAIRADQITQLGRITDQIMDAIETADIVIADITGRNANVLWELGFAHALGKPCALLMRNVDQAPFDIYDHRRVDYQPTPTEEDERRLADILRSALGAS
jgi:nucleoside 2-deoxyribosyltransferase